VEAFLIRFEGEHRAFLNLCSHLPLPLDSSDNDFFTLGRQYLICKTHGAVYGPADGCCVSGPGSGRPLKPVRIVVDSEFVRLHGE